MTSKYEFMESLKTSEKKYAYPVAFMCDRLGGRNQVIMATQTLPANR